MSSGTFMFISMVLGGPLVSLSSSSWMICWVGIELSFMGFIPIMISSNSPFSLSKESSIKYFCIQAMGSGLLLCGGLSMYVVPFMGDFKPELIFLLSLLIKLGVAPFHFWVPSVVSGLEWMSMCFLLTWMKFPPFFFFVNMIESAVSLVEITLMFGGLSAVVGAYIGLNQTKLSPMLAASSISHSGWMLMGSVYGGIWVYFMIYSVSLFTVCVSLEISNNLASGLMILSLSGLPPFVMFLGKMMVVKSSCLTGFSFWFLILPLFGSVLSLFFYLKFFYSFYLNSLIQPQSKLLAGGFWTLQFFLVGVGLIMGV